MANNIFMIRHKETGEYLQTTRNTWSCRNHAAWALGYLMHRRKKDSKDNYDIVEFELKEVTSDDK